MSGAPLGACWYPWVKHLSFSEISHFLRFPSVLRPSKAVSDAPGASASLISDPQPCIIHRAHCTRCTLYWLCCRKDCSLLPTCMQPFRFRLNKTKTDMKYMKWRGGLHFQTGTDAIKAVSVNQHNNYWWWEAFGQVFFLIVHKLTIFAWIPVMRS